MLGDCPTPYAHLGRSSRAYDQEAEALRLARAVALTTIAPEILEVRGRPCLLVERYDRTPGADGGTVRLHQEDLRRATGRDPRASRAVTRWIDRIAEAAETAAGPGYVIARAERLRASRE